MLNDKEIVLSTALQLFIKAGREDAEFVPRQQTSTIKSDVDVVATLHKWDNGKWKSRWFVLRHGRLYKYNSKDAKHPYGFYDLRNCRATAYSEMIDVVVKNPRPHTFVVDATHQTADKHIRYIFAADSDEAMKTWIAHLNNENVSTDQNKVFGVALADVRDRDANGVPLFFSALLTFLEATALNQEDLFTKPPDEEIKRNIDRGKTIDLTKVSEDIHAVAALIHHYLHDLPDSLIPEDICPTFYGLWTIKDKSKRLRMLTALSEILPILNRNMLIKLFSFLHHASQGAVKRERLSKMFARLIFRVGGEHQLDLVGITEQLMEHWQALVVDEQYVPTDTILVVKKSKKTKSTRASTKASKKASTVLPPDVLTTAANTNTTSSPSTPPPAAPVPPPPVTAPPAAPGPSPSRVDQHKPPTPAYNDYNQENDDWEESSEEEEWSDTEVQVMEVDSDEESEEEDEYSEGDLLDELSKAASSISLDIELPPEPYVEPEPEPEPEAEPEPRKKAPASTKKDKSSPKVSSDEIQEIPVSTKSSKKNLATDQDTTPSTKKPKKNKEKTESADSKPVVVESKSSSDLKSSSDSKPAPSEKKKHKKDNSSTTLAPAEEAATPPPRTPPPAGPPPSANPPPTQPPAALPPRTPSRPAAPAPFPTSKPPTAEPPAESVSEVVEEAAEVEPVVEVSEESTTQAVSESSESVAPIAESATETATEATTTQESTDAVSEQPAEEASSSSLSLSLEGVEPTEPEVISPVHRPLAAPVRPKKATVHAPSRAKNPNQPATRPPASRPPAASPPKTGGPPAGRPPVARPPPPPAEPALSPQQQLVADLSRALGRRPPPGGIAVLPMLPKKAAPPPEENQDAQ